MKNHSDLKKKADTYFFKISKVALFITAIYAIGILFAVYSMNSSPAVALKYYFIIPELLKSVLLVCVVCSAIGLVFEAGTN